MAMLKSLRKGTDKYGRNIKELDQYLRIGDNNFSITENTNLHKSVTEEFQIADSYLKEGHQHQGRCLAFGKTKYVIQDDMYGWSKEFADVRLKMGGKHYNNEVFYYHYTISPDPRDHASAEEVRDLALEWVNKVFPDSQAIVSVHNDNKNQIMHAHIVVNAVYPLTGKRIQISKAKSKQMARDLQELCKEHAMSYMSSELEKNQAERRQRWARNTHEEQNLISRGVKSWKQDIRDAVDESVDHSYTWSAFKYQMGLRHFKVRETRNNEVTYYHPESTGYDKRVRGIKLGDAYTRQGVTARLLVDMKSLEQGTFKFRELDHTPKVVGVRPMDKCVRPMSPFEQMSAMLLAKRKRVTRTQSRQMIEDHLNTMAVIKRENISDWRELIKLAESAKIEAEELAETFETATNTFNQLKVFWDKAQKAKLYRREIASLPQGIWSIGTRRMRNELEEKADVLEQELDKILSQDDVKEILERLDISDASVSREYKFQNLVLFAKERMPEIEEHCHAEQARLKTIIDAAKDIQKGMYPCVSKNATPSSDIKPLRLKQSMRVTTNKTSARRKTSGTKQVEQALANLAAAKIRKENQMLLAKVDERMSHEAPRSLSKDVSHKFANNMSDKQRIVAKKPQNSSSDPREGTHSTPSADDVMASVRAARINNQTQRQNQSRQRGIS